MNTETPYLERIIVLIALCITAVLFITGSGKDDGFFGGIELMPEAQGESRGEDHNYRMSVNPDDPQPNGDHWSVYVILEEKQGEEWNKTTRDITAQIVFYRDSEEDIIIEINGTDGLGFVLINLSYELPEGEYTVRAKAVGVDMDWKKEVLDIPLSSRPPHAVAKILVDDERVKETTVILDRAHEASLTLDSSESWDPDEGETEFINYTWTIGDTVVSLGNTSLLWTFTEAGDYLIKLKAEDPSEWNMYSEDWVVVHVKEIPYQPDLEVSMESNFDNVEVGDEIKVTVTIDNIGNDDAWGFDINFYDRDGLFKFRTIGLIPFGTNRTITFDYTPVVVGQNRIQVKVDPTDEIPEFDEDNNEASFDLQVRPKPLPEMIIETLATNGSYEVDGLTFITIILKNSGTIDAGNVKAYLYINNELVVEEIFESVGAGERTTVVYTWMPKVEGNYTAHIIVWVDAAITDNQYINDLVIISPEDEDPDEPGGIPVKYIAAAGGALLLLVGAIGFFGAENSKYRILGSVIMTPLYTRLKKEDTLNHEVRARVYEHIVSHPGDSYASILKALDLKNGTLVHHLRTLERERYVKSKKDGKFKRFYLWGTKVGERDPKYLTGIQMEIVDIIKTNPGVSQANIANSLHRSRQSINYQIKILAEAGLINVIKHGISTRCYDQET